ncbi:hypothetical protein OY671_009280, partial [Metschnikowia pulcherrima]
AGLQPARGDRGFARIAAGGVRHRHRRVLPRRSGALRRPDGRPLRQRSVHGRGRFRQLRRCAARGGSPSGRPGRSAGGGNPQHCQPIGARHRSPAQRDARRSVFASGSASGPGRRVRPRLPARCGRGDRSFAERPQARHAGTRGRARSVRRRGDGQGAAGQVPSQGRHARMVGDRCVLVRPGAGAAGRFPDQR